MQKIITILTVYITFFTFQVSYSQISFEKNFGDTIDEEIGFCAKQTYDKGYIAVGTNFGDGAGFESTMLIKTDSLGNELWSMGGWFMSFDLYQSNANSLKITTDSGFIITGASYNIGGSLGATDIFLLKTDIEGNQQWVATYDSIESNPSFSVFSERGNDVIQTTDGGYLVAGQAGNKELVLLKTDAVGNKQWVVKDTGLSQAAGYALIEAENNTYLVIGSTTSIFWNTPKMYLTKFDANGNKIFGQTYGWSGGNYALGYSVKVNANGEYVLLGLGRYNGSQYGEMLLIKTDTAGNLLWENSFLKNQYTAGYALDNTNDSGYILTGYSFDPINGYSVYLVKTDSLGTQLWDTTYSGDGGYSVQQTFDNGYIIVGSKWGDIYLLKTSENGILSSSTELAKLENVVSVYPNPTSGAVKIRLKTAIKTHLDIEIIDLYGRRINSKHYLNPNSEIILERELFTIGVNFIKISTNGQLLLTQKVVITN